MKSKSKKTYTDFLTPEARSKNMAAVKGKNTKPEIIIRSLLHRKGYRFRINVGNLPGKPDIVMPKHRTIIFVNGCFWHQHPGCKKSKRPATNCEFWNEKLNSNIRRDEKSRQLIEQSGWKVIIDWGCEL